MSVKQTKDREYIGFRPDADVNRLLNRAQKQTGWSITSIVQKCIRIGLKEYAGKKDQNAA